jgi:DNA-binding transcriptional MerR regulator
MDLNRVLHDAGLALDNVDALDELLKQADDEVEEVRRQLDSEDPLQLQSQINELLSSADLPDMTHLGTLSRFNCCLTIEFIVSNLYGVSESEVRELHQETKQHYAQAKFMHQHVAQLQLNAVSVHAVDAYITLANQVVSLSDKVRCLSLCVPLRLHS